MELSYTEAPSLWTRFRFALAIWNHPRIWLACSITFGVVAPLVCFGIATWEEMLGLPTLALDSYAVFAAATMGCWLAMRGESDSFDAIASGVFFAGALFAIPFALYFGLFGVFFLLVAVTRFDGSALAFGCLGVAPLAAVIVYGISGRRAMPAQRDRSLHQFAGFIASIAVLVAVGLPLNLGATAIENLVLNTDQPLDRSQLTRWRLYAPGYRWPGLVQAMDGETSSEARVSARGSRIAQAFEMLTGDDIEPSD